VHSWSDCVESRDSVAHGLSLKKFRVGRIAFTVLFFATVLYFSRRNRTEHVSIGFTVSISQNVLLILVFSCSVFYRRRRSSSQAVEMSVRRASRLKL